MTTLGSYGVEKTPKELLTEIVTSLKEACKKKENNMDEKVIDEKIQDYPKLRAYVETLRDRIDNKDLMSILKPLTAYHTKLKEEAKDKIEKVNETYKNSPFQELAQARIAALDEIHQKYKNEAFPSLSSGVSEASETAGVGANARPVAR